MHPLFPSSSLGMPIAAKLQRCEFLKDKEPWYHAFLEAGASMTIVFPKWTLGTRA
jgi:hypothetical protein